MSEKENVEALAKILHDAERVAVLTGAGISAESGIPTFRGEEGLWKTYRAEELATPSAFHANPNACLGMVRLAKRDYRIQRAQ